MEHEPRSASRDRRRAAKRRIGFGVTFVLVSALVGWSATYALPREWLPFTFTGFGATSGSVLNAAASGFALSTSVILLMFAAAKLRDFVKRSRSPDAQHVLARDPRSPIVYLRSFADERRIEDKERAIAALLEKLGPFIAIGRPGELFKGLGASRMYLSNDSWQSEVQKLLGSASVVVILAGNTPGLGWELARCKTAIDPRRIIILIPTQADYIESFAPIFHEATGISIAHIQESIVGAGLSRYKDSLIGTITFDAQWRPHASFVGGHINHVSPAPTPTAPAGLSVSNRSEIGWSPRPCKVDGGSLPTPAVPIPVPAALAIPVAAMAAAQAAPQRPLEPLLHTLRQFAGLRTMGAPQQVPTMFDLFEEHLSTPERMGTSGPE